MRHWFKHNGDPARHILQLLRHIFGNDALLAAACAGYARRQNVINPGQFGRQWLALGFNLLPFGITVRNVFAGNLRCRRLFLLQTELKLIQTFRF